MSKASLSTPSSSRVYHVTSYGADPTGKSDSTDAILRAITDAINGTGDGFLIKGIVNLGGVRVDLDGGNYLITRPIQFPLSGRGNLVVSYFIPNSSYTCFFIFVWVF